MCVFRARVSAGSPSRGGDVAVYVFDINQLSLPTPFHSVLVSTSVFMAILTVLQTINSPDNSPLYHSALSVLLWLRHGQISVTSIGLHTRPHTFLLYFLQLYRPHGISPMGNLVCFPRGKPAVTESCHPIYGACSDVSVFP